MMVAGADLRLNWTQTSLRLTIRGFPLPSVNSAASNGSDRSAVTSRLGFRLRSLNYIRGVFPNVSASACAFTIMEMQDAACGIWTPSSSAPTHSALPDLVLSAPSSFSGDRRGWLFAGLHFHDGPPKKPRRGRAALAAPGLVLHFKISKKNKKRSRLESAFGFPLLSCKGYAARWRWALLVLASRFASTPY